MFSDRRKHGGYLNNNNNNNNNKSSYGRGGGGGGGSMVVLSRPRSSQNAGQKLSVPPPLNLPSLRKEHERVDPSGSTFLSGGGVSARPASSGMGWSKPSSAAAGEGKLDEPLLVRSVEKVSTLRGEDFPSLKASLPSASAASVSEQKHKDGLIQKQKREEFPKETRGLLGAMGSSSSSSLVDVRPQNRFGNEEFSERPSQQQVKKKDYLLPGPLPIVRMSPRSDWADDERDTSHGFREREYGYSKSEPVVVREANAWRVSSPEVANNNSNNNNRGIYGARPNSRGREGLKKNNYVVSGSRENVWNNSGAREAPYRQPWNNNSNMDNSGNRGAAYGIDHQSRDKRPLFKNDKPHVEDHFGDSGFDVHDPFPVLGVAKKKKEALKQAEFHDPVRESFEAELERVQKMQEEERRRIIEEQERVIELVRTEEEERLRLAREQDEQQSRLEEEAREAAVRNEQERLEAARRAEELRKSKEEEKHKLILEEERRKQAAKQKLLELEEKISRRQAEAAKGCSNSSTVSEDVVKEKESSDVDWEDSERMVDRITTSSASRDGSFGFQDRHKPFWRKEDVESGGNSRFMENVPQRDVGEGFPKEFFGATTGYIGNANSYFKPGFPEHSVDQSWRTPGDGRSYGRNYGMEQPEPRESFGEQQQQYGNPPEWGQGQSRGQRRGGAYPYPEKLYPNHEEDDYYPFGRPKYSVRQPRVLPPPQESRQKLPFRSEVEHHPVGPSTSVLASYIGDLQDHHVMSGTGMDDHRFDSKLTGRCDSQSSLSITSTPDSLVHISHDDLDESGNSSVLVSSRKGDGGSLLDAGKDSLMTATCPVSCWDNNEEWTLDNNERLQEQEEYDEDEDGYQEEDKVHGVDENLDLTQELEELHLQEKDSNLVLGFNEGVEVEIPSDDLEKKEAFPLPQHPDSFLDGERPSVETSCDEQAAKPVEISDKASASFQGTETTMQNSASYPTVSTHLVAPPYSIGLHQTHVPSTSAQQMEDRVQFQFGLFSGPSLIPSPYPAIQIGSIQMPLPIDPQFGSSLTHIQQPQSQFIQFGQVGYTSLITQGVLPPPPPPQNPGSMATGLLGQGNQVARNAAAPASNPQISVLRRPVDVSDGDKPKNANVSTASAEVAVPPPHKPGEFSGKSEPASRKMSHGRSNFADRQSGGGQVVRNSGGPGEVSRGDAGGYRRYQRQRVEFRVREPNWPSEENRNGNGKAQNSTRSGSRKYVVSKSQKYSSDSSVSGSNSVQKAEGPSDNDDDFIEVRSKRQMLNDRREQREKEIKEKSQASKASRKPRSTLQNSTAAARSNRSPPAGRVTANTKQISSVSNRQLLAPIGTPSPKTDSHGDEKSGSSRDIPDQNPASSFVFSNKNNVVENVQTSVGTWSNQLTDQPVMALTQSQLDEAMKPASLLSCVSVENGVNRNSEPNPKSNSVAPPKNNTFPSPINPLLAEGKIQFGAVTSSSVIPPCGENNSSLYFEKDRTPSSSTGIEICEAEAAASAIAVAAITSDETSGNAGSVLPAETKIYGGTSGTVVAQPSLSKAEESLIVSLPADLSVDTPISLWPPVPSPHNSNQMITHFPPAPPHFPFYDMNPMLRGPIYAFGPHHDSGANQPQSQKGPSGPPTTWQQQGHSGVDSFYAPAGFTGPFLTPPGAMPGVQGPPHMFVYNHFAPVGQFGGLSFMGTTYIPSGKQPDWKHNPMVSSSQVGGDGDANNPNVSPMQCNVVPASLQHMAMPSPLAMFEPSPFQSSSSQEMPVRARWPYMPFPGPPTMQIQNQQEAVDGSPSQFNNNNNNSMLPPPSNRYPNIQTPTVADAVDSSSNSYGSASQPKPITTLSDPNSNTTQNPANPAFKPPPPPQQQQQSSQEKNTQSQHVGGSSHHNQHQHQHNRRSGFHGRNQAVTRERGYHNNTKVKQIYVAKQSSSNSNNASASASASSTTTTSPSM
ncbi:Uncharacterized protein HA466_0113260 [Hirschfeldia incana]|nr:Uncharacterized protein HA466_0113260 [Hirschfeldia incana]